MYRNLEMIEDSGNSQQITKVTKLTRLQKLAYMCNTGTIRNTPTTAMENVLGLILLDIQIKMVSIINTYKMRTRELQ